MSQTRKPSSALAGQSRRAISLGDKDPRAYRSAQAFTGDQFIDNDTIRKNNAGQLFAHHTDSGDEDAETESATDAGLSAIELGLFFRSG